MPRTLVTHATLLLVLLICSAGQVKAQQSITADTGNYAIKGQVLDAADETPIEMATVSLLSGGKILDALTTDLSGHFVLQAPRSGSLVLTVSYLGYTTYTTTALQTKAPLKIMLQGAARSLEQVEISARKKTVHYKSDRLIYDATADIGNKAGTAGDVLRKVPMLTVGSDGELRMRGNANIKVLLNGIPTGIMARNIKEALKMIPASSIKSVEVITTPSAQYEAEGAAGVINIITKKPVKGTNGSLDLSAGNLEQSANGAFSITGGRFDFGLNATANAERQRLSTTLNRTMLQAGSPQGRLLQNDERREKDRGLYAGMDFAFRPDTSHKISAALSYWHGNWPVQSSLYNDYADRYQRSVYTQSGRQTNAVHYYELSLRYEQKFKRKAQALHLLALSSYSAERSGYNTVQTDQSGFAFFRETSPNRGKTWEFNVQADYTHPLDKSGKSQLETGIQVKSTNAESRYSVLNNQGAPGSEQLAEVPSSADVMRYYSHIFAGYLSLTITPGQNWTFRPGIRFEQTVLSADFKSKTPAFSSRFGDWVPSILVVKKINERHDLKLGYTERIRRPWIWDLNPYINAADPRNLSSGNPQLKPERIRTFELGHNYTTASGFNLNSSVYFSNTGNAIASITTADTSGILHTRPGNIASNRRLGINVNASLEITANWLANGGLELYYVWFKSDALKLGNRNGFYAFNLNTSYNLPKQYSLQASGDYSNGYLSLQGRYTAEWSYRFSVQKQFLNDKASLILTVSNPFGKSMTQQNTITDPGFTSTTHNRYYNRSVQLSFSWKFGSGKQREDTEDKAAPERENYNRKRR